ncbi:MAG: SPFH domain-containing protein, partial [Gillisia sp.]
NSNLILLPNSPQAGSDMLNNMIASFTASNQIGEAMRKKNDENLYLQNKKKERKDRNSGTEE